MLMMRPGYAPSIGLIALNSALALGVAPAVAGLSVLDVAVLAVAGAMIVALVVRAFRNLRELARLETAQTAP